MAAFLKHYTETALALHKLRVLPTTVEANKNLDCEAEEKNKDFFNWPNPKIF